VVEVLLRRLVLAQEELVQEQAAQPRAVLAPKEHW